MSENTQATGTNETKYYLPSVTHQWTVTNPFYYSHNSNCRECLPKGPMESIDFKYGPFPIGSSKWQLEFRLPSCDVYLKCVESDGVIAEDELSFQLTLHNIEHPVNFTFTSANQEVYVCSGLVSGPLCDHYAFRFVFKALVHPANYAGGLPCDFRVVVLDKNDEEKEIAEFAAHRSILSKGSPVFKTMLAPDSKFKEAKEGLLKIGNFSPETVKSLLIYIYTGNENLVNEKPYSEAMELLDAVEQYQVYEVFKKQCCARLLKLIDCRNALGLLAAAERYHWDHEQKQAVVEFIREKRREIIQPNANNEALKRLPFETLVELLKAFFQK